MQVEIGGEVVESSARTAKSPKGKRAKKVVVEQAQPEVAVEPTVEPSFMKTRRVLRLALAWWASTAVTPF